MIKHSFIALSILAFATTACGDDDGGSAADAAEEPAFGSAQDVSTAQQLWSDVGSTYQTWGTFPGLSGFVASAAPHGAFAKIYINDTVAADIGAIADGGVIIKENYTADNDNAFDSITVMYKKVGYSPDAADWFWAKLSTTGDVLTNPAGVSLAGRVGLGGDSGCIPCHQGAGSDFLFSN